MDFSQIKTELGAFSRVNNKSIMNMVYNVGELSADAKVIPKVDDEYPAIHTIGGRLIKEFRAQFDPVSTPAFKAKILKAYPQKADLSLIPSDVMKSWLASEMYDEDKPLAQKSISRFIMEQIIPPLLENDLSYLEFKGVYSAGTYNFGESMNGLLTLLTAGLTDTDHPMYRIPVLALTNGNIVDQVTLFEKNIPERFKPLIKKICMSNTNKERYKMQMIDQYGAVNYFAKGDTTRTMLGDREVKGYHGMNGSDLIWCTIDGNLLKLIDKFKFPGLTSIQEFDRTLKLLFQFTLGFDFGINQIVFVSDTVADVTLATRGLVAGHSTYYPEESTTPIL